MINTNCRLNSRVSKRKFKAAGLCSGISVVHARWRVCPLFTLKSINRLNDAEFIQGTDLLRFPETGPGSFAVAGDDPAQFCPAG